MGGHGGEAGQGLGAPESTIRSINRTGESNQGRQHYSAAGRGYTTQGRGKTDPACPRLLFLVIICLLMCRAAGRGSLRCCCNMNGSCLRPTKLARRRGSRFRSCTTDRGRLGWGRSSPAAVKTQHRARAGGRHRPCMRQPTVAPSAHACAAPCQGKAQRHPPGRQLHNVLLVHRRMRQRQAERRGATHLLACPRVAGGREGSNRSAKQLQQMVASWGTQAGGGDNRAQQGEGAAAGRSCSATAAHPGRNTAIHDTDR